MESDDRDVEVFERIPWESLERSPDRRWVVYLIAACIVVAAIGISIGRGGFAGAVATPTSLQSASATSLAAPPPSSVPPPKVTSTTGLLSEADLLATPAGGLEMSAAAVAEWFVTDWFTRDGSGEEDGRSFVEWAAALETTWVSSTALDVTVVTRRLAALGDDPYRRLDEEAWVVTTELREAGWVVVKGPVATEAPTSGRDLIEIDGKVPPGVTDQITHGEPTGAEETQDGWLVAVSWTDPVGLTWPIHQLVPK